MKQADWNTLAGTTGVTYQVGDRITTAVAGSTLSDSDGTVSSLPAAPTATSSGTLGQVVTVAPGDVLPPYETVEAYGLAAYRGRFLLNGRVAEVRLPLLYALAADRRAFAMTGRTLGKRVDRPLAADAGSFAVTGADAMLSTTAAGIEADGSAFALTGLAATLTTTGTLSFNTNTGVGTFSLNGVNVTLDDGEPIAATYSQSSVYSDNAAATAEGMTNGVINETVQTGTNSDSPAWLRMDFGVETAFNSIVVGPHTNTLAGGWGADGFYVNNSVIEGSNNASTWTSVVASVGTFTTTSKTFATPGQSWRYVRIRRTGFLAVTEFYALRA